MHPLRVILLLVGFLVLALLPLLLLGGCARLDRYERNYSLSYTDADGHELRGGVTLHPRGYAK